MVTMHPEISSAPTEPHTVRIGFLSETGDTAYAPRDVHWCKRPLHHWTVPYLSALAHRTTFNPSRAPHIAPSLIGHGWWLRYTRTTK
jgi:hypothetical protein